jgi:hypothetical protein
MMPIASLALVTRAFLTAAAAPEVIPTVPAPTAGNIVAFALASDLAID